MTVLDRARSEIAGWGDDREPARRRCLELLQAMNANLGEAVRTWEAALAAGEPEPDRFRLVPWFGAERARALHRLHLEQRDIAQELTELTAIPFKDTMGIVDEIDIVEAYAQVRPGDSAADWANAAIATLRTRAERLTEVIAAIDAVDG